MKYVCTFRLRKAIRHAIQHSREAEHHLAGKLNEDMLSKVMATRNLKEDLERQLDKIKWVVLHQLAVWPAVLGLRALAALRMGRADQNAMQLLEAHYKWFLDFCTTFLPSVRREETARAISERNALAAAIEAKR